MSESDCCSLSSLSPLAPSPWPASLKEIQPDGCTGSSSFKPNHCSSSVPGWSTGSTATALSSPSKRGSPCPNHVTLYLRIFHLNLPTPLFSSEHLDAPSYEKLLKPQREGGTTPLHRSSSCCECGQVPPLVRGDASVPYNVSQLLTSCMPVITRPLRLPPRLRAVESPHPSSTDFSWDLHWEAVKLSSGLLKGYHLILTSQFQVVLSNVEQESSRSGVQYRPTACAIVLTLPPCGTYLSFLLYHHDILLWMLRRAIGFAYSVVPAFYDRFHRSSGSADRRVRSAASSFEKEKETKRIWRELKRELHAALSFTRPIDRVQLTPLSSSAPPTLLSSSRHQRESSGVVDDASPSPVSLALGALLQWNAAFTSSTVVALLACQEENLSSRTAEGGHVAKCSRVVIFSQHAEVAHWLLQLSVFLLQRQSSPASPPEDLCCSEPNRGKEGEGDGSEDRSPFLHAFGGVNASLCGSFSESASLPVDCGLRVQWIPLRYSEKRAQRFLSPFSGESRIVFLCPDNDLVRMMTLQRSLELIPLTVAYGGAPTAVHHPFPFRVIQDESIHADPLLTALLHEVTHLSTSLSPPAAFSPAPFVLSLAWIRFHAYAIKLKRKSASDWCDESSDHTVRGCTEQTAPQQGGVELPFSQIRSLELLFPGIDKELIQERYSHAPVNHSWLLKLTKRIFHRSSAPPARESPVGYPELGTQLCRLLTESSTFFSYEVLK